MSAERHWSGAVSVIAADGAAACERDLLSVHRGSFGVAIFGAIFSNVRSAAAKWSVCRLS
jgi:hypothetical protein